MSTTHFRRVRGLTAALAIGVLCFGLQAPAQAAAPLAPGNLAPDGIGVSSNTPTLSWSKVSGGVRYEVEVDNASGSTIFTASTTNNRVVPTKVLPNGEVTWHVRAFNASSQASSWSTASFTVSPTAAPTPISPVGGEPLAQPDQPPLLSWSGVQGATGYTVQVDTTDAFTAPLVTQDTQSTSLVVPQPLQVGEYFWRVKATKGNGADTDYSDPIGASFVIGQLEAPSIVGPTDSPDNEVEDVVLDWNAVRGAAYYQLEVATDQDFNTIVDNKAMASSKVYGTNYSPSVTYDNNQYYWRVRGVDVAGNPGAWARGQFDRTWDDTPQPVYPLGSSTPTQVSGDMHFEWTPVQHASQYELQLGTDPNFSPGTTTNCQIAGTTYTPGLFVVDHTTGTSSVQVHEKCAVVPGTTYYWRVRALDRPFATPGVEGLYSETQTFRYDDSDFTELSPAGGETVAVPTLRWSPVRGADHYVVGMRDKFNSNVFSNKTTYSTSYTQVDVAALDPADGPFTWSITAFSPANTPLSLTHHSSFNVAGAPADTPAAPLTPLSGTSSDPATTRAPALTWEPYPGAAWYTISAGVSGSGNVYTPVSQEALGKKLYYPAVTDTWTRFLTPGDYDWFVEAWASNGSKLGQGSPATFTISQLAAVDGQQIALTGSALDSGDGCTYAIGGSPDICTDVPATPVFDWEPVEGAGSYLLYVSEDASFTNLTEPLARIPATTNTRWAPTMSSFRAALPDSQAGGAYYWFVRPCKTTKVCGPSPVSVPNKATNKFRKKSPPVTLLSPAVDATVTSTDLNFTWTDYRATNAGTLWATTGEASNQSAKSYRVQVDNDANFASPLESVVVDQTSYTSPTRLYPEGELYWRVQAIDADDNGLSWSAATSATVLGRKLTKDTTKPAPQTPTNGSSVSGTAKFSWAPMASAGSYQLEVYKNDDIAATLANRLFQTTNIKPAAYVWNKPIPVSATPYAWRVRRVDTSGNPGPWSGWRHFTSTGTAPTQLAPAAGALQPPNGPLFSWNPVTGATTYVVEGRSMTSTVRPFTTVTTAATAWATTAAVPNGLWEWRVIAKDAGGAVLGTSTWRSFKVDTLAPKVISRSPARTASRTANFVVKFSEPVKNVTTSTFRIMRRGTTTPLAATVSLSADKKRAVLNPSRNLRAGTYYTIRVTNGVRDLAGNRLVSYAWTIKAT